MKYYDDLLLRTPIINETKIINSVDVVKLYQESYYWLVKKEARIQSETPQERIVGEIIIKVEPLSAIRLATETDSKKYMLLEHIFELSFQAKNEITEVHFKLFFQRMMYNSRGFVGRSDEYYQMHRQKFMRDFWGAIDSNYTGVSDSNIFYPDFYLKRLKSENKMFNIQILFFIIFIIVIIISQFYIFIAMAALFLGSFWNSLNSVAAIKAELIEYHPEYYGKINLFGGISTK
jgi:hypothetical protein